MRTISRDWIFTTLQNKAIKTQQAGTMFRPVGIVVASVREELLLRRSLLGGWLGLRRLGWLGGFLGGLGRGSFLRGHFLGSFREGLRVPVRKTCCLSLAPS